MFKRTLTGRVTLRLEEFEKNVLENFVLEFVALLGDVEQEVHSDPLAQLLGMDGPTEISSDPAIARLFPNAYVDDEEAASDFRRYTEPELRSDKVSAAKVVLESLVLDSDKITLSDIEQKAWLSTLNDLRLVLGVRLNITAGQREDSEEPLFQVYDWMTWLQGTLIESLD